MIENTEQQQHGFELNTQNDKSCTQAFVKTYPGTGTYVFINLHKKNRSGQFFQAQHIGLTMDEFLMLLKNAEPLLDKFDIPSITDNPLQKRSAPGLGPMMPKKQQRALP